MPLKTCLDCGRISEGSRCPACATSYNRRRLARAPQQQLLNSRAWRKLSLEARRREPLCRDCAALGRVRVATQVHHPRQRAAGGPLLPPVEELVPLCGPCHGRRTAAERYGQPQPATAPPQRQLSQERGPWVA